MFRGITLLWPGRLLTGNGYIKYIGGQESPVQKMMHQKEYNHMINWVEKHIVQSIFAQKQKETIAKCILYLKLLPKKAQTSQSINASISIETATNS